MRKLLGNICRSCHALNFEGCRKTLFLPRTNSNLLIFLSFQESSSAQNKGHQLKDKQTQQKSRWRCTIL